MNNTNDTNNISFLMSDTNQNEYELVNNEEWNNILKELEIEEYSQDNSCYFDNNLDENAELIYDMYYKVKDLLKICRYYGIEKNIKSAKCKKQDIITSIIFFEQSPENYEIVQRRHRMWDLITELLNDPMMKQYVIWN
jgi:hypothetical protein